jgi:membrane protein
MTTSRSVKYIAQLGQQSARSAKRIGELTRGWSWMLADAARETLKPDTAITAAAIAYFALFSLFPIILLTISIASFSLDPSIDLTLIFRRMEFIAPALGQLVGQNIDEIIKARGPITGFASVGLIWAGSTVFYTFTHTLNEIWGVKQRRSVWKRRGLAVVLVLLLVGPTLFLASVTGSLIAHLRNLLPAQIIEMGGGISLVLAILLDVALFMMLYMVLPHGASSWREILPGAMGAGFLWELAKNGFLYFVSTYISVSNLVYGSVTAIITFLAWAYLSSLIFLFGAFLSVAYFQFKERQEETVDEIRK